MSLRKPISFCLLLFFIGFVCSAPKQPVSKLTLPYALYGERVSTIFLSVDSNEKYYQNLVPISPVNSSRQVISAKELWRETPLSLNLSFEDLLVLQTDHKSSCEIIRKTILNVTLKESRAHYPSYAVNLQADNSNDFMTECGCSMVKAQRTHQFPYVVYSIYYDGQRREMIKGKFDCLPVEKTPGVKSFEHLFIVPVSFPTIPQNFLQLEKVIFSSLPSQRFLVSSGTSNNYLVLPEEKTRKLSFENWNFEFMSTLFMGALGDIGLQGSIVIIGAGTGEEYLKIMSSFSGKNTKLVAFEPIKEFAEILRFHKYVYGWDALEIQEAAVGTTSKATAFSKKGQKYTALNTEEEEIGSDADVLVPTVVLDSFLLGHENGVLALFIDINGEEYNLLIESDHIFPMVQDAFGSPSFAFVKFNAPKNTKQSVEKVRLMKKFQKQALFGYLPRRCDPLEFTELNDMADTYSLVVVSPQTKEKYEKIICPRIQKSLNKLKDQKNDYLPTKVLISPIAHGGIMLEGSLTEQEKKIRISFNGVEKLYTQFISVGNNDSYILASALGMPKCNNYLIYSAKEELDPILSYTILFNKKETSVLKQTQSLEEVLDFLNQEDQRTLLVFGPKEQENKKLVKEVCNLKESLPKSAVVLPKSLCPSLKKDL